MSSYCLKCKKIQKMENIDSNVLKTKNDKTMILLKWAFCGSKKSRFIKNQETRGVLSNLGFKTPISKIPLLGDILFWMQFHGKLQNKQNS